MKASGPLFGRFVGELGEIVFTDAVVGKTAGKSARFRQVFQSSRERFSVTSKLDVTLADKVRVEADEQWTGGFNPRPFDEAAALEVYRGALRD